MTSITAGTTPLRPARPALLAIAATYLAARLAAAGIRTRVVLAAALRIALTVTALAGFTTAAWHTWGMGAGVAVGSVACLVLEYAVKSGSGAQPRR